MRRVPILLLLIFNAPFVRADDITTLSGQRYIGVAISRVEPDGLIVVKSDGIVKILFIDLSPELRAKYGYDPNKAAEFSAALQAADVQRQAEAAAVAAANAAVATKTTTENARQAALAKVKKFRIQGHVFRKTEDGLILERLGPSEADGQLFYKHLEADRAAGIAYAEQGEFLFLRGYPDQERLADKDIVDVVGYETGVYSTGAATYHALTFFSK